MKTSVCSLLVVFGLMLAGCFPIPPLYCTDQTPCGTKTGAVCVLSEGMPGACALPDDTCPSKYRYYKDSGFGRDNKCADLPTFELQSLPASVDEHQIFSMHAVIKDGSGQKITNYKGNPIISAEWGDARVFSFSGFFNGEADYTLWVNRETNPKDGPERLNVKDGKTVGRSGGVEVTVKPWKLKSSSSGIRVLFPSVINRTQKEYVMIFGTSDVDKYYATIERATTDNLLNNSWVWNPLKPILDVNNIPWKPQKIYPSGLISTAAGYLLSYYTYTYADKKIYWETGLAKSTDSVGWNNISQVPMSTLNIPGDSDCQKIQSGMIVRDSVSKIRIFYKNENVKAFLCTAESVDDGDTWTNAIKTNTEIREPYSISKESSVYRAIDQFRALTSRDGIKWSETTSPFKDDLNSLYWADDLGKSVGLKNNDEKLEMYLRE